MPYIPKEDRLVFEDYINILVLHEDFPKDEMTEVIMGLSHHIRNAGDLNYVLSSVIWRLFNKEPRYSTANWLIDTLQEVKLAYIGHSSADFGLGAVLYNLVIRLREAHKLDGILGVLRCVELEFYRRNVGP